MNISSVPNILLNVSTTGAIFCSGLVAIGVLVDLRVAGVLTDDTLGVAGAFDASSICREVAVGTLTAGVLAAGVLAAGVLAAGVLAAGVLASCSVDSDVLSAETLGVLIAGVLAAGVLTLRVVGLARGVTFDESLGVDIV